MHMPSPPPNAHVSAPGSPSHAALPRSPSRQWAQHVSNWLNPLLVVLPEFLLVALRTTPGIGQALLRWMVTTVGMTLIPLAFIGIGVRSGRYTDAHLGRREQRIVPLLIGIAGAVGSVVALIALHSSRALLAAVASLLIGGVITLAITTRWKISLHIMGMAGAITVLTLLFGPVALLLTPLLALVAWARLRLHAHTPAQVLAGMALTVAVTLATFWLAGVR